MIVPFDTTGYNAYASAAGRGAIALPRGQLLGGWRSNAVNESARQWVIEFVLKNPSVGILVFWW